MIPYYIFGIAYLIVLAGYIFFLVFNIHHMIHFGFFDFVGQVNTVLVVGVSVLIVIITAVILRGVDWLETISLFTALA